MCDYYWNLELAQCNLNHAAKTFDSSQVILFEKQIVSFVFDSSSLICFVSIVNCVCALWSACKRDAISVSR